MAEEILYDAEAGQRVRIALQQDGEICEVAHLFKAFDDDDVVAYLDASYWQHDERDSQSAASALWDKLIAGAEGYQNEDGSEVTPNQLIASVEPQDKYFAIENALLATRLLPASKATGKKFVLGRGRVGAGATYKFAAFFNGGEVSTTHILRRPDTGEYRDWQIWHAGAPTSRAQRMIDSYDKMKVSASGYANRVPAHHKVIVFIAHMSQQQRLLLGK